MCVVSMIGDWYGDKYRNFPVKPWETAPSSPPWVAPVDPVPPVPPAPWVTPVNPTTEDIVQKIRKMQEGTSVETELSRQVEELRRDVFEMKELLKKALEYDERNHEPHCENDDKIAFLRKVAESVGLTLDDVFPRASKPVPPPSRLRKEYESPKKKK